MFSLAILLLTLVGVVNCQYNNGTCGCNDEVKVQWKAELMAEIDQRIESKFSSYAGTLSMITVLLTQLSSQVQDLRVDIAGLKNDFRTFKDEVRQDIIELKNDFRADFREFKNEVATNITT